MLYRLTCGCVVIPTKLTYMGDRNRVVEYRTLVPCHGDSEIVVTDPVAFDPNAREDLRKQITDGEFLLDDEAMRVWAKVRDLLYHGYRYRDIKQALRD